MTKNLPTPSQKSNLIRQEAGETARDRLRDNILARWQWLERSPNAYPWPWESSRWHELVFCILYRLATPELPPETARTLTLALADLGLLDVNCLAAQLNEDGEVDPAHPDAALMLQLLQRAGLPAAKGSAILTTLGQVAAGFEQRYHGKVQRYLRHYGHAFLDGLHQDFSFSKIGEEDMRQIFTHWLQNVLNLPLPVSEPAVAQFCAAHGASVADLLQIADELDLNVALLDDLIAAGEPDEDVPAARGAP